VRTQPVAPLGKPCYNCHSRHLHNWNTCKDTPATTASAPSTNAVSTPPCYQCQSTIPHNWSKCDGNPPKDAFKASLECFKCNSTHIHKWLDCKGIPPHLMNDPEVQDMISNNPNVVFKPRPPPRETGKACWKCGGTFSHTWNTCTATPLALVATPPQKPPRKCPICQSQNPHDWTACKTIYALNPTG
jgi:hypothetical protein